MEAKNSLSLLIKHAVQFHSEALSQTQYPFGLKVSDLLLQQNACNVYPDLNDSKIFFLVNNDPRLPGLEFPVIKYLTVLKESICNEKDCFAKHIKKYGNTFLVIIESYNAPAIEFLRCFKPKETYFCQQKLLCALNDLQTGTKDLPAGISIRHFIPGSDESKYTDFYNRVLGFLAGKTVDTSFMDQIVARPSFDPAGYFIAEKNNNMVGFLSIEKEPWGERNSGFGYIYQIGVDELLKGTGLAECLLGKAREYALNNGIKRIGVGVRRSNTPAVRFFKKNGFNTAYEVSGYLINLNRMK